MRTHLLGICLLLGACHDAESKPALATAPQTTAVAFAFEGSWGWMGNDLYERRIGDVHYGAYQHLRVGLEMAFAELPVSSEVAIITYDQSRSRIVLPMGAIRARPSVMLGAQLDYEQNIAPNMLRGVELGMSELARSTASHKLLVVVGSGTVTDQDNDPKHLAELRSAAERAGIETVAIVLPMFEDIAPVQAKQWTDYVIDAHDTWQMAMQLRAVAQSVPR